MTPFVAALLVASAVAEQPTKRPSDAERGQELWERHCTACHGPGNRGDGPATEALVVSVPDLRNQVKVDEATLKIVLRGKGGMPGYETSFDKADARRVLKYMSTVHQKKATAPAKKPADKPAKSPSEAPDLPADDAQGNEDASEE